MNELEINRVRLGWAGRLVFFIWILFNIYLSLSKSCSKITWCEINYFKFTTHIKKEFSSTNWYLFNNYKLIQIPTQLIKINCTNTKESSLSFENLTKTNTQVSLLHNINIPKYKIKLQMPNWIANLTKNKNI